MSEASNRWRCPYCDGLNSMQDAVCQICGDGKRDEVVSAPKATPEIPKTYTPPRREPEPPRSEPEPRWEAPRETASPEPTRPVEPTSSPAPEPKPKKKHGFIWMLLIVALAYGGGRLLGGEMGKSFLTSPSATSSPVAINPPAVSIATVTAKPVSNVAAQPTEIPYLTPIASVEPLTGSSGRSQVENWNYREASDAEISDAMALFWYGGTDDGSKWCAVFMNTDGTRGGCVYDNGTERKMYVGSLSDGLDDTSFLITHYNGTKHNVRASSLDEARNFRLRSIDDNQFGEMEMVLNAGLSVKQQIYDGLLTLAHGDYVNAEDGLRLAVGSKGEEVRTLQQNLIKLGYLQGSADGVFGKMTEGAVKEFQAHFSDLEETGVINRHQYDFIAKLAAVLD